MKTKVSILSCILLSLAGGCATFEGSAYSNALNPYDQKQYHAPLVVEGKPELIALIFHTSTEVQRICGVNKMGCQWHEGGGSIIVMLKPNSWNDDIALRVLGHEVLHAMGAQHE